MYAKMGRVDRAMALSIPAVKRGRDLICSIATLPLVQYDFQRNIAQHPLLRRIDPNVANLVTLADTLEDLFFEGTSWWWVIERDFNNFPTKARHLDHSSVRINPPTSKRSPAPLPSGIDPRFGVVWVDSEPVSGRDVIRFDSPNQGLLSAAGEAIKLAVAIRKMGLMYADNPRRQGIFTPRDPMVDPGPESEVRAMVDRYAEHARTSPIGYVGAALNYQSIDTPYPAELQLIEQARQATLDIANAIGLDPEDVGVSTTSRTYQNAVDRRKDRINDLLASYMKAITETLSGDNVTRRGYEVAFDLDDYLRADPKTRAEIDQIYNAMGARAVSEIRRSNNWAPLTAAQRAELEPAQRPDDVIRVPATVDRPALAAARFEDEDEARFFTFEATAASFGVDFEKRTITGLVVPFGRDQFAVSGGKRWRFEPGSIQFADMSRIKLLRDHDWSQALGHVTEWTETPKGIVAKFKVARGPEGDKALALAEDKVLDGLSVNVDPISEAVPDPENHGVWLVKRSTAREVSMTARPAFDNSRITSVVAQRETGDNMPCTTCGQVHAEGVACTAPTPPVTPPAPQPDVAALGAAFAAWVTQNPGAIPAAPQPPAQPVEPVEEPAVVNPTTRPVAATFVNESLPYRFSYQGGKHVFRSDAEHDFSTDLLHVVRAQHEGRDASDALTRVNGLISAAFADVESADVTALNPNRHRPDMWQPQMDYATPLWDMVNDGPTDGSKFEVPKFNSASGLVGPATEKVEPAGGSMVAELQTITPTQVWGKVEITRQAWRAGGSPQLSGILWDQMLREYYEDREAAVATFLNTLTAATDITLPGVDASPDNTERLANAQALEAAIAGLQFVRGGNRFRAFAVHEALYRLLAQTTDTTGRPLYPQTNPTNANGTASNLFSTLNIAGTTAVPSWALGSAGGNSSVNSWLFDPAKVRGWASAPERLFWDFGATVQTANLPQLSFVTLGIYGDVAFANLDIAGVRQVIFDQNTAA